MKNFAAIVLAAGKGTRMKSRLPKVLHPVAGRPMIHYPLVVLKALKADRVVVVVGHKADEVEAAVTQGTFDYGAVDFVVQDPQLGTGHAVMCAAGRLRDYEGDVLILSADVPLITEATVKALFRVHRRRRGARPALTLTTVMLDDPGGYGRIVRDSGAAVERVVEHRDLAPHQRGIREVNAGVYLAESRFLFDNLEGLGTDNAQGEYYLPDLVALARDRGRAVAALTLSDPTEVMGVNNRAELAAAAAIMRRRINTRLMLSGVTIVDPAATYIDDGVKVGADTVIYPNVHLAGRTVIGGDCVIEEGSRIEGCRVASGVRVRSHSVLEGSTIGEGAVIGPFARLRPESRIGKGARVGNFVEIKKTALGKGSKANHLAYLGDASIGEGVNIGAGVITCNYDGEKKHRTVIEDGAFIGSDSQFVAPVKVGRGSYIGSGSTITKDVPAEVLALSRAEQKVVEGWLERRKAGQKTTKKKGG